MSRRLKVLAILTIVGWVIAVPFLLFAVLDPFVKFSDWPSAPGARDGDTVQLREPTPSASARASSDRGRTANKGAGPGPDPVAAARDALALLAPRGPVAAAVSFGG